MGIIRTISELDMDVLLDSETEYELEVQSYDYEGIDLKKGLESLRVLDFDGENNKLFASMSVPIDIILDVAIDFMAASTIDNDYVHLNSRTFTVDKGFEMNIVFAANLEGVEGREKFFSVDVDSVERLNPWFRFNLGFVNVYEDDAYYEE